MSFDRAWVLAIAWLPVAWAAWEWTRTRRRVALALKAISLLAILLALAEPRLKVNETRVAVAVLVDTSDSISPADLERASQLAQSMQSAQGRHWMRVMPFARSARTLESNEQQGSWKLRQTAGEAGRATDIESGVREAIASLPAGLVPRVVLISDGKENKGSIARAAWQAQQLGIPIDTFALAGTSQAHAASGFHQPAVGRLHRRAVPHRPAGLRAASRPGPDRAIGGRTFSRQDQRPAPRRRQSRSHAHQPEHAGRAGFVDRHPVRCSRRRCQRSPLRTSGHRSPPQDPVYFGR